MKESKISFIKLFFGIFFSVGMIFVITGIIIFVSARKVDKSDYDQIYAVIDDIERWGDEHHVYINYTYDGTEYNHVRYNRYSSGMRRNEQIEVMVNRYNPTDFYIGDIGWIFLIVFGGLGGTFAAVGGVGLGIGIKNDIDKKRILANGTARWGTIVGVRANYSTTVNGRHPYRFIATYEDESIVTTTTKYNSSDVWIDGEASRFIGQPIKIMLDVNNPKKYVIDINSIPKV